MFNFLKSGKKAQINIKSFQFTRNYTFTRQTPILIESVQLTRAKKKAGGKRKKKEPPTLPEGYNAMNIVNDWYKFRPEDKIKEIEIPWKEGEEPEWVNKMLAAQDEPKLQLHELDLEKHGLKYTWRKLRESDIKEDNEFRKRRRWGAVPSLQSKKHLRKKPVNSMM